MVLDSQNYYQNDELKIYRGQDFVISKHIKIHQPTLGEICDYGEESYYLMIHRFVSTPQDLKAQLWKMGIDYTTISPFEIFCKILCKLYSESDTAILFGDLDFLKFKFFVKKDNSFLLQQQIGNDLVSIDEYTYNMIVDYICKTYFIKRDLRIPANNSTKMALIEDAIMEQNLNKTKEFHSQLKDLISAAINSTGFKYNHSQVWDMPINAFMDSIMRIKKIKNADLLLQSGYSGFGINLDKIEKKQLDWLGELTM